MLTLGKRCYQRRHFAQVVAEHGTTTITVDAGLPGEQSGSYPFQPSAEVCHVGNSSGASTMPFGTIARFKVYPTAWSRRQIVAATLAHAEDVAPPVVQQLVSKAAGAGKATRTQHTAASGGINTHP